MRALVIRQVLGNKTPFSVRCECQWVFLGVELPFSRIHGQGYRKAQVGVERPGIPSVWANFQGDSRAYFADYSGEERVVTTSSVYISVTMFLVHKKGKHFINTSVRGEMGASWASIVLKSDSWAVCVHGAWATEIHAFEGILGGERAPAVQIRGCPRP